MADKRVVALFSVALLVAVALLLIRTLRSEGATEDCLMAGRGNCNSTITSSP